MTFLFEISASFVIFALFAIPAVIIYKLVEPRISMRFLLGIRTGKYKVDRRVYKKSAPRDTAISTER